MNNQNSGQRVTRMERHISSPREGRRGCDGGAGGLMRWRWYAVERRRKTEAGSVCFGERGTV